MTELSARRTGSSFDDLLFRNAVEAPPVNLVGASGYFTRPIDHLDPHLFDGTRMRPEVRRWVLGQLYAFWDSKQYVSPLDWSTVWIAGSGITYQWSAGRESGGTPGDLDVLIGVNFPTFFRLNPTYQALDADAMANYLNDEFRNGLDLTTAHATLPTGGSFEVTFYVNPGAADIRVIHPYAAYNLTDDTWTVAPIRLPHNWGTQYFPGEWWQSISQERHQAEQLLDAYNSSVRLAARLPHGSPQWLNAVTSLHEAIRSAKGLFDSVHGERRRAFSSTGQGYRDYYNFRWQAHKQAGVVPAMHALASLWAQAHKAANACYGPNGILDTAHAYALAALTVAKEH